MSDCIEAPGSLSHKGYGRKQVAGVRHNAHRAAWIATYGDPGPGVVIDHTCRNRRCTNIEHLEAVTHAVNVARGQRANQTHCKHGHPLSGENLYIAPKTGKRNCRACARRRQATYAKALLGQLTDDMGDE